MQAHFSNALFNIRKLYFGIIVLLFYPVCFMHLQTAWKGPWILLVGKGIKHAERVMLFHHGCSAPARTEINLGCCLLPLLGSVEVTFPLRVIVDIFK